VSIKDIARQAEVSHSTVSRALGNSPLVSEGTKDRIQRLAQEMGYSPDAQARSLVLGRTLTIGVVVTYIADPFIAQVVQGIETTAHDHGYSVLLVSSQAEPEREIAAVEMLRSQRVDGVIVASSRVGALYRDHLERIGVPVILVNSMAEQGGRYTHSLGVDNRHGGRSATEHLIQKGHRRISYVARPADLGSNSQRLAGYEDALNEAGIPVDPSLVVETHGHFSGGRQALPQLLSIVEPATAAFCYNDMTAIGLISAAREAGLELPQDLAVVGFDDIPFASYVYPALTTIAQPTSEMGRRATEMLLGTLVEPREANDLVTDVVVRGQLVVRGSSGPAS
jgi:DNA-binding LacI/PurR family transcriptional regulator